MSMRFRPSLPSRILFYTIVIFITIIIWSFIQVAEYRGWLPVDNTDEKRIEMMFASEGIEYVSEIKR